MNEIVVSVASDLIPLYEVVDSQGIAIWGGSDGYDAIYYLRRSPAGSRVIATLYDEDGEDAWLVGSPIDITPVVVAALATGEGW